ncbi:hypothetical protein Q4489_06605 [Thalassotalea sp. 1_MG-2023]|uniref:hypothetical protein n=1 Tax=Thalassotalea sp. 1_MG-2023 TaxID=3062680 RepID=UPI0026E45811|nr:hypothetical protein [Thalassotalea sp. 1_MG-2023]MDO6426677.1 hypothetical protein [Thalassotalea sp. 1_MG-2023]
MNDNSEHQAQEDATSANDVALSDILSAWQEVLTVYKLQILKASDLVGSEIKLSVKAMTLSLIGLLVLVGIGLIMWITLCLTIAYTVFTFGGHWLLIPSTVLLINAVVAWISFKLYKQSKSAIGLPYAKSLLMNSEPEE